MDEIKKIIRSNRDNISDSSIKTYSSIIKNVYMKITNKIGIEKAPWFLERNHQKVIDYLKGKYPFQTRKLHPIYIFLVGYQTTSFPKPNLYTN